MPQWLFLSPFSYCDNFLLFTREGDPRFYDVINSNLYKLVGTSTSIKSGELFQTIVKLDSEFTQNISTILQHKSAQYFSTLLILNTFQIYQNPYSDYLRWPIFCPNLDDENKFDVDPEILSEFQKTETFDTFRNENTYNNNLRLSFLSLNPQSVLEKLTNQEKENVLPFLDRLRFIHSKDTQFVSILQIHTNLIQNSVPSSANPSLSKLKTSPKATLTPPKITLRPPPLFIKSFMNNTRSRSDSENMLSSSPLARDSSSPLANSSKDEFPEQYLNTPPRKVSASKKRKDPGKFRKRSVFTFVHRPDLAILNQKLLACQNMKGEKLDIDFSKFLENSSKFLEFRFFNS